MPHVHFLSQNRPGPRMGMGHYERLLIRNLGLKAAKQAENWRFSITFDGREPPQDSLDRSDIDPALQDADFLGFSTQRLSQLPTFLVQGALKARFQAKKADLFHSLALSFPAPHDKPTVITIHDLPPAYFPDEGVILPWAKKVAQNAAAILTPSEFAKQDLIELLDLEPARVHVVFNGCEHNRYHPAVAPLPNEELRKLGIEGPFLLYAGGFTRRKNVAALLGAWKSVASDYPALSLILAGPPQGLNPLVQASGAPRARAVGYVTYTAMPALMKAARALVCPSIYEGFGLPPLEAMALGVPVIGSLAGGAVPEVIGNAGILADDGSPRALAEALRRLLNDQSLENHLKTAGPQRAHDFSWTTHARNVLKIYRGLSNS